jgi:lipopolysaccharide/colanic/teichoic acid biosynthesis glycosyltransferase
MSTSTLIPLRERSREERLDDFAQFTDGEPLPDVPWLMRLPGGESRRGVQCLPAATRTAKRIADVVVAATLLVLLSPLMLLIALLVRLTSHGPIIYQQTRVGLNRRIINSDRRQLSTGAPSLIRERRGEGNDRRTEFSYGRHFTLYKFRTMREDAERNGARFAVKDDDRVTFVGRFLRLTRLDELPQLWNVLRGEMTLVGPRPERPEFVRELSREIPNYLQRLGLKPGLTGVAQVVNGYDNDLESFRRKVAFDLLYLQNCCVWNDLKIIVRTIGIVLTGKGAL